MFKLVINYLDVNNKTSNIMFSLYKPIFTFVNIYFVYQNIDYFNFIVIIVLLINWGIDMASKNYFLNGVAELLILSILKKNDTYIYGIKKIISEVTNDVLPMSQNTIYAAAYKLENEKKISEYSKLVGKKRTRIYYHIEDTGLEYLDELTTDYNMVTTNVGNILKFLETNTEDNDNE